MNELNVERLVDLRAEEADIDVHRIGLAHEVEAPYIVQQRLPADDPFLVLQQIEGNLIYPKVVGGSIGLPAIWVLVAVTLGGSLFGIVGMLVFIPIVSVVYTLLKDDHYSNGTNQARSGYAGVVLHVQKQADKKSSVTVKQDNGAVVTYGNLNEVKVKQDDRILKEAVLGTADSYVTINALKDNEKIKVSDAFS